MVDVVWDQLPVPWILWQRESHVAPSGDSRDKLRPWSSKPMVVWMFVLNPGIVLPRHIGIILSHYAYDPCMVYLPTFALKINHSCM